ncbi:UNVERIFIED_CONTAM: hypothetical protein K2H54_036056 [Gekko kuhli]
MLSFPPPFLGSPPQALKCELPQPSDCSVKVFPSDHTCCQDFGLMRLRKGRRETNQHLLARTFLVPPSAAVLTRSTRVRKGTGFPLFFFLETGLFVNLIHACFSFLF